MPVPSNRSPPSWWTSTTSSRSTTRTATWPATRSSGRSRRGCGRRSAPRTCSAGTAARSSSSCWPRRGRWRTSSPSGCTARSTVPRSRPMPGSCGPPSASASRTAARPTATSVPCSAAPTGRCTSRRNRAATGWPRPDGIVCHVTFRFLVVGGTGFLGQHVVAELLGRGHHATVLARGRARPALPVDVLTGDVMALGRAGWAGLLDGYDGVVFAAGADDRVVPRAPAAPFFRRANVAPVAALMAAARDVGCTRAVILGSYYTFVHRQRPELRLADRHPYVASRVEQAAAARQAAGDRLPVAVLEIPFVFGSVPGRRTLWAPLVPWLRARYPLFAPPGGTAAGRRPSTPVRGVPAGLVYAGVPLADAGYRLRGRQPGLRGTALARLLTSELFVDPAVCREHLGVTPGGLDEAMRDTVVGR